MLTMAMVPEKASISKAPMGPFQMMVWRPMASKKNRGGRADVEHHPVGWHPDRYPLDSARASNLSATMQSTGR